MQINNSALRITRVCQPASFKRNRRGYKNPESFYRTPRASRKQRQSREGAGEPWCEVMPGAPISGMALQAARGEGTEP